MMPIRFPRLELTGDQICSIDIIAERKRSVSEQKSTVPSLQSTTTLLKDSALTSNCNTVPTWQQEQRPPSESSASSSSQRKSKGTTPRKAEPTLSEWSRDNVQRYKDQDFDFQANLDLFDKKKIFSEIRAQDATLPKDRLVSHNLSQRKLRPDQNVLESSLPSGDDDDQILLETASISTSDPVPAPPPSLKTIPEPRIPIVEASSLTVIEQQVLLLGVLNHDQLVENAGRSLCSFLFGQNNYETLSLFSSTVLLTLSADRLGVYALSAGRHLLNRGVKVKALLPVDMRPAPNYFKVALNQFSKFNGIVCENSTDKEESPSLVISSAIPPQMPPSVPICSLGPIGHTNNIATWHVRFGLPAELPADGVSVICDVGWPAALVDTILDIPKTYGKTFGLSSYVVIGEK